MRIGMPSRLLLMLISGGLAMVGGLSIPAAGRARRLDLCVRMIEPAFAIGDEVSVKASCILFHIPGHKEGRDAQGMVGTVARVYNEPNLSPIQPVKVSFTDPKPWTGHFEFSELEFANGPNDALAEGSHASAAAPPTGLSGSDHTPARFRQSRANAPATRGRPAP